MLRRIVITVLKNNCMSHILSLNNFLSKIELSVSLKALSSYQKSCLSQVLCSFWTYDVHFWSSYIYYIYHTFNCCWNCWRLLLLLLTISVCIISIYAVLLWLQFWLWQVEKGLLVIFWKRCILYIHTCIISTCLFSIGRPRFIKIFGVSISFNLLLVIVILLAFLGFKNSRN